MDYVCHYDSPLGGITLLSDGEVLTGLWFDQQKYFPEGLDRCCEKRNLSIFDETCCWLDIYFSCRKPEFTPCLSMQSTDSPWNI
jgi:methylated-DNA-[protein]-cysteine S-methyltransferase